MVIMIGIFGHCMQMHVCCSASKVAFFDVSNNLIYCILSIARLHMLINV